MPGAGWRVRRRSELGWKRHSSTFPGTQSLAVGSAVLYGVQNGGQGRQVGLNTNREGQGKAVMTGKNRAD